MPKAEGHNKSIALAKEKLRAINIQERLQLLGFDDFDKNSITTNLFGNQVQFDIPKLELTTGKDKKPCRADDEILFLHYLLNDIPVKKVDEYISFRELSSGVFYLSPYTARTVKPLVKRFGDDIESLKANLNRYNWEPHNIGDFSAKIHAIGDIYLVLIYYFSDDEFPASAELLFPFSIKHVYNTEDAVVLASRICIGLL
jgi:hypothetical protein